MTKEGLFSLVYLKDKSKFKNISFKNIKFLSQQFLMFSVVFDNLINEICNNWMLLYFLQKTVELSFIGL